MQVSDWISLGSSIGALVAAIVALVSLTELIRQRKSSYRPDLSVLSNDFRITYNNVDEPFPLHWDSDSKVGFQRLPIVNVGLGVAKSVKVKWEFDHQKLLNKVIDSAPKERDVNKRIKLQDNELWLIFNNSSNGAIELPLTNNPENELEYIIPAAQIQSNHYINLPTSYEVLASLLISHKLSMGLDFDINELVPLKLSLTYNDIGQYRHQRSFMIKPKFITSGREVSEELCAFDFEFSLKPHITKQSR